MASSGLCSISCQVEAIHLALNGFTWDPTTLTLTSSIDTCFSCVWTSSVYHCWNLALIPSFIGLLMGYPLVGAYPCNWKGDANRVYVVLLKQFWITKSFRILFHCIAVLILGGIPSYLSSLVLGLAIVLQTHSARSSLFVGDLHTIISCFNISFR